MEFGRFRLFPYLCKSVRLHSKKTLIAEQFALLKKSSDRVEKIAVINCVAVFSVNVEQIVPDVLAESALVLGQHERRLRNELKVDFDFV